MAAEIKNTIQDTLQVGVANLSAVGISLAQVNQVLTTTSLLIAITFSIYKFYKLSQNK